MKSPKGVKYDLRIQRDSVGRVRIADLANYDPRWTYTTLLYLAQTDPEQNFQFWGYDTQSHPFLIQVNRHHDAIHAFNYHRQYIPVTAAMTQHIKTLVVPLTSTKQVFDILWNGLDSCNSQPPLPSAAKLATSATMAGSLGLPFRLSS